MEEDGGYRFLTERWIFVDSITFSSPWEDLRSVWEGESLQLKGTKIERGGDKKFDLISFPGFSSICPRDELLQLLQNYSVHMHVTQSDMGGRCLEISC